MFLTAALCDTFVLATAAAGSGDIALQLGIPLQLDIPVQILGAAGGGAAGGAAAGGGAESGGGFSPLLIFVAATFFLFYFMVLSPEKKRKAEEETLRSSLKMNDRVITVGGIHGTIGSINEGEDTVSVKIDGNTRIKVSRTAIAKVIRDPKSDSAPQDSKSETKGS